MVHVAYCLPTRDVALGLGREEHVGDRFDLLRLAVAEPLREPALDRTADNRLQSLLLHDLDAVVPDLLVLEIRGRVGENQPVDALRRVRAHPHADHAAHRKPAPVRLFDLRGVEHR